MTGPEYVFFKQDKNNRFYQPDSDGKIIASSKPYPLEFSPDGWDEIEVENIRNKKWWGIDRSVATALKFVKDGAKILKSVMLTKGVDEILYTTICKLQLDYTGSEYGFWYKKLFRGQDDFTTYLHDGSKVTCSSLEEGLAKYLKSAEGTTFELSMNVSEALQVKFDGVYLKNIINFGTIEEQFDVAIIGAELTDKKYFPLTFFPTTQDNSGTNIAVFNVTSSPLSSINYATSDKNFMEATGTVEQHIEFINLPYRLVAALSVGSTNQASVNVYIKNQNGTLIRSLYSNTVSDPTNVSGYINDSFDLTVNKGDRLFLIAELEVIRGNSILTNPGVAFIIDNSDNKFTTRTRFDTTYVPHLRGQYIFEQLLYKVTEGNYTAEVSAFLEQWKDAVFTCGDAVRGIVDADGNSAAVMKITMETFRQFWDCFFSVGISEKSGKVNFDEKINLVDKVNRIALGEPSSPVKVKYEKGYGFNVLRIGYPEIKNDVGVLNGNEEFNCTFEWTTGTSSDAGVLDKVSKIKASCYEQEKIRITLVDKDTTDNKSDNDVFVNYIGSALQPADGDNPAHYLLDRSLNASATGLIEPATIWNLRLSPKRMLLNNGSWIRSCLFLGDGKMLKYTSADKNNKMECDGISEKADVAISTLASPFFYPLSISVELPAPENLLDDMDANPAIGYSVPIEGDTFTGILLKNSVSPSSNKAQTYELLLDSENDITKFIEHE
jgi:hypothetical protein